MLFQKRQNKDLIVKRRAGRKLNVTGIKQSIVFLVGTLTAMVSGLTGLGAQLAFGPMLTWMLGLSRDRAQSNAMRFACVTSVAAVIGSIVHHSAPAYLVIRGCTLFFGAVLGALLSGASSRNINTIAWRRFSQTLGVGIALVVTMYTARLGRFDTAHIAEWRLTWQLGGMGFITGIASQLLALPSGMLMVPALYFFGGFTPSEAITLTLFVVACASFFPTLGYIKSGAANSSYTVSMLSAAVLGGFMGGLLLPIVRSVDPGSEQIAHKGFVIASAVISMFLCARQLALISRQVGNGAESDVLQESTRQVDKEL